MAERRSFFVLSTPKMSSELPLQQQFADLDKVEGMLTHWEQMLVALSC